MANTVTALSYANTFGHWVTATNTLINENNILGKGDYTKDSGTIYISETTKNSLQANGNVVVQSALRVQGVGSSTTFDNNLTVKYGQVYFQNTSLGLVNSGNANVGGVTFALGSGEGLRVANNAVIYGNQSVVGNTFTTILQANSVVNTANASITHTVYSDIAQANTRVLTDLVTANSKIYTNSLQSNTDITTASLQANTVMNTSSLSVTGNSITNILVANSGISTVNTFTNTLQSNTSIVTGTLSANTLVVAANVISNGAISATGTVSSSGVQANNTVNTSVLSATTQILGSSIQANNAIVTGTLSANTSANINALYANTIQANTSASIPNLTVGTKFDANAAAGFINSLQVQGGGLTVNGNFVLTGSTIYAANTFRLSDGVSSGISSYIQVARGTSGANAAFRWNEPQKYWDTLNVTSNNYYRILTDEYFNDTVTNTSTTLIATANSVNAVSINAASSSVYANGAFVQANAAYAAANNVAPQIQPAFLQANSAFIKANGAYNAANLSTNYLVGTTGTIAPSSGYISFTSNNGITIVATSANNFAISDPQDLRTTATPTFAGLSLTTPLALSQGGTGQTSASGALNALLPTGTTSGYVLTTGGPGNFYWAAGGGGGGGGATPGTTINSTRLSYTANGVAGYTGNSFVVPPATTATQVRAYINGVRQFESEYTLSLSSSSNTISFLTTPPSGDSILVEVDGYYVNPYYANNIAYTINGNISSTANTIQLAIDGLTSKVVTYYANTNAGAGTQAFNNIVTGITVGAGTSNTAFATTAYVQNLANNSGTLTTNITGNSGTVTNGVYTNGSYSDPSWITALANTKITGTMTNNQIGTGAVGALNMANSQTYGITLSNSGVIAGSYGSGTTTPVFTVDASGRITSATAVTITGGSAGIGATTYNRNTYTATAGQTTFSATYTVGYVQVYVNGVLLPAGDYTASNGTSVVLGTGANSGDSVDIFTWTVTNVLSIAGGSGGTVLYQSAANTTSNTAVGTTGQILTSAGTGAPYWSSQSAITLTSSQITTGLGTIANTQFNSIGVGTAASTSAGEIRATGTITSFYTSDVRYKENIKPIESALDKVVAIGGKTFDWTDEYIQSRGGEDPYFVRKSDFGVVAQDVQQEFPVATRTKVDGTLAVDYEKLCALAFQAIAELKAEVDALKGNNK